MKLIILHKQKDSDYRADNSTLGSAMATESLGRLIADGLRQSLDWFGKSGACCVVPQEYAAEWQNLPEQFVTWQKDFPIDRVTLQETAADDWHLISNGRFVSHIDARLLKAILSNVNADVVAVTLQPSLGASQERIRLTPEGSIAGIRRVYEDSTELRPMPHDWPHCLFVRGHALEKIVTDSSLPESFAALMDICRARKLTIRALNAGGTVTDLETSDGLLGFVTGIIDGMPAHDLKRQNLRIDGKASDISGSTRLIGRVLMGGAVDIGTDVVIVGPTVIGDNAVIGDRAVIGASVIGAGVQIPQDKLIQNSIVMTDGLTEPGRITQDQSSPSNCSRYLSHSLARQHDKRIFRTWPAFSYARCFKRIADMFFAAAVLLLFAPIMPFIAVAIKITSPGPVFFRHRREGLRGKPFDCLKFRSMHVGSDEMQDKLRMISQVDGPQFKMEDDPRISKVGRFLRETYIDEIPQFLNVLAGQMSIIGPRPSPRKENTQCPQWRDARLSVRPGITGLWQIHRTRLPMRDFQEWIHFDVEYVRTLSLKTDIAIFWNTLTKLVDNFIKQF